MNERSCHVEECPNPREEQNQREGKKYKPHEQTPLWPAMISLFGESKCSRGSGPNSGKLTQYMNSTDKLGEVGDSPDARVLGGRCTNKVARPKDPKRRTELWLSLEWQELHR